MLTKFILIAVFVHGYGPRTNYANLGEFENMQACQSAAAAVRKAQADLDVHGNKPKLICAAKR